MSEATPTTTVPATSTTTPASPTDGVAESIQVPINAEGGEGPETTQEASQEEVRKYNIGKVKFRGKEVDLGEMSHEDLVRRVQQGMGANTAYEEAKKLREEANAKYSEYEKWKSSQDEFKTKLTKNPIQAALESGADPAEVRRATEEFLLEQIKQDEMSPEARENIALKRQLEEQKKKEEADAKQAEEQRLAQAASEFRKQIVPQITQAFDTLNVPKTAANVKRAAEMLRIAAARKLPMDATRATELIKQENDSVLQTTIGGQVDEINKAFKEKDNDKVLAIGKELESFLGEQTIAALQRYGIVKHRAKLPSMPATTPVDTAKTQVAPKEEKTFLTEDEALEERRRRVAEAEARWKAGAATAP